VYFMKNNTTTCPPASTEPYAGHDEDRNWGLFRVTPVEGKKPEKEPATLDGRAPVSYETFRATLSEALEAKSRLGQGFFMLGYLPRAEEGSQSRYMGVDVDYCVYERGPGRGAHARAALRAPPWGHGGAEGADAKRRRLADDDAAGARRRGDHQSGER
jgi:hypothetical protein